MYPTVHIVNFFTFLAEELREIGGDVQSGVIAQTVVTEAEVSPVEAGAVVVEIPSAESFELDHVMGRGGAGHDGGHD